MAQIATVATITGKGSVFAVNEQGVSRQLKAGDVLQKGETIRTVGDVQVELRMDDGRPLAVAPNQTLRLDDNVTQSDQRPTAQDSAVMAPAGTADTVIQALERGTDLSTQLEATAAGLGGGAGADGGNTFVQLLRIVEGVDPLAYEYDYTAPDLLPDVQSNPDILTSTTMVLTADTAVFEGSPGVTYTVTLGKPAISDMTVTLSNGAVVVIPAGSTTGSVRVPVQGDDVYKDSETLQATVDTVQGGGYTSLAVTDQNVTTVVNDTVNTVTVSIAADGDVKEDAAAAFTVSVSEALDYDLEVELSNGAKVTIKAGDLSVGYEVAAQGEDIYVDPGKVELSVKSAVLDGAELENLELDESVATVNITDTIPSPGVTVDLSATATVAEGVTNGITYTATLTGGVAQNDILVTLANGETITIAAGQTSGTVSINSPSEDIYIDASTITNSIATAVEQGTTGKLEAFGVAADTSVSTSVTDTIPSPGVTVDLSATATVAEGVTNGITYTATLTGGVAQNDILVTLANGETITIAAGQTSGTVSINSPSEDIYIDASTITNSIATAVEQGTTGKLEAFGVAADTSVSTSVTDTIPSPGVTVDLSATATVAEGVTNGITYTATLTGGVAQNDILVTLANGETITIAAGQTSGTVSINSPSEDIYIDASTITNSIATAVEQGTTGKLEAFGVAADTSVSTSVTDTIPSPGVTVDLSATATVAEGVTNGITYTATLTGGVAQNDILVTLANGETITIAAGQTSGTVSINSPSEDIYIDASTITNSIATAVEQGTTGKLEAFGVAADTSVSTSVTDTIPSPGVTVDLSATATVAEGVTNGITYTATLTGGVAQNDILVTLANGETITIAAGQTSGTVSINSPSEDIYIDASTITNSIATAVEQGTTGKLEAFGVAADTSVSTSVTDTIPSPGVTVDLSATATVAEGVTNGITYTATLTGGVAQNDILVTLANGETITIAAGQTSGTVSINSPSEDIYIDASTITNSIATAVEQGTTGKLEAFGVAADTSVSTSVTDTIPSPGVTVDLSATATVAEGVTNGITYTATLTGGVAQNDILVTLANGETITIAAGQTSGTVSINSPSEDIYIDASTITNSIATAVEQGTTGKLEAFGVAADTSVSTSVTDTIPSPGVTVDLSATATVAEGVTNGITYTATLTGGVAQNDILVTLANGETITIAAGQTSGTVSINSPSEDIYIDASTITNSIATAVEQGTTGKLEAFGVAADTSVSTSVTDTIPSPGVTVDLSATATVAEGVTNGITYTATLTGGVAQNDILVTLANGETITIAAGQTSGTVSINSPSEDIYIDASTITNSIATAVEQGTTGKLEAFGVAADTSVSTSVTDTIDTVYVKLSGNDSVAEADGAMLDHTLSLVDNAGNAVNLATGQTITVTLNYTSDTTLEGDFTTKETSVTITGDGSSTYSFANTVADDILAEGTEGYTVSIASISGGTNSFENVAVSTAQNSATGEITDSDILIYGANLLTNTNVEDQVLMLTVTDSDGVELYKELIVRNTQGMEGTLEFDQPLCLDKNKTYDFTLSYVSDGSGQVNLRGFTLLGQDLTTVAVVLNIDPSGGDDVKLESDQGTAPGSGGQQSIYDEITYTISYNGTAFVLDGTNAADYSGYTRGDGTTGDNTVTLTGGLPYIYYGDNGNDTITGTGQGDRLYGDSGDDTLNGGDGDDLLSGGLGSDVLNGDAGNDMLLGGEGSDTLSGNQGDDYLAGGSGSDTLTGGDGSDVFAWTLADSDTSSVPNDIVKDFNLDLAESGGDVLNLQDLAVGEQANATSLDAYLHFSADGNGDTVITVDSDGGAAGGTSQTITLENVKFTALQSYTEVAGATDADIITKLLAAGNLKTDV